MHDMTISMDLTQASTPGYFEEYFDRGKTPFSPKASSDSKQTQIGNVPLILSPIGGTLTIYDLTSSAESRPAAKTPITKTDPFLEARSRRVSLLVSKYDGSNSNEDNARLEILTQRIRSLSPRITKENLDGLTSIVDQVESVSDSIESLRAELELI